MASSTLTRSPLQQANFLNNSDPAKGISLVIPRVFNNIGSRRIKKHMIEAQLGVVERVDVVPVAEGKYKRAFVHFAAGKWNMRDSTARDALKALQAGERIKLEYESPWYWLVSISISGEAPKPRERKTKVVIETGSSGESKQNNTEKIKRANATENRLKRANAAEKRLNKTTKKGGRRKKRKTRRKKKNKKKCRKKRKKSRKTKSNK